MVQTPLGTPINLLPSWFTGFQTIHQHIPEIDNNIPNRTGTGTPQKNIVQGTLKGNILPETAESLNLAQGSGADLP
jgi:hypothetical protein